jgi:hypothetical protein
LCDRFYDEPRRLVEVDIARKLLAEVLEHLPN